VLTYTIAQTARREGHLVKFSGEGSEVPVIGVIATIVIGGSEHTAVVVVPEPEDSPLESEYKKLGVFPLSGLSLVTI